MKSWVLQNPNGIIIHSAAVGDYAPTKQKGKIKSGQKTLSITMVPTIKILDQIKKWSPATLVVSFKAAAPETTPKELTKIAQNQRTRSKSDLVFANVLTKTGQDVQLISSSLVSRFSHRKEGIDAIIDWVRSHRPTVIGQ
jgi:phosphopantothenoylcysteine synthetase/decarboxylase